MLTLEIIDVYEQLILSQRVSYDHNTNTLQLIAKEGPYPMLMAPPDGGYWIQNGEHESARSEDGTWRAPEIDTEHFTVEMDAVANVYRKYFKGQVSHYPICKLCPLIVWVIKTLEHSSVKLRTFDNGQAIIGYNSYLFFWQEHANYISRDSKVGPVLLSIKTEQDYQGMLYRAVLRTQKTTFYKVMPKSTIPEHMEPEDFIKVVHEGGSLSQWAIRIWIKGDGGP